MALGVSLGTGVCAIVATLQLGRHQNLWPFRAPFIRCTLIGALSIVLLFFWQQLTHNTAISLQLIGIVLIFSASLWASLQLGLRPEERAGLGGLGRWLARRKKP
jgi:ABC-type Fe3+-siderophore transport system permease subunit